MGFWDELFESALSRENRELKARAADLEQYCVDLQQTSFKLQHDYNKAIENLRIAESAEDTLRNTKRELQNELNAVEQQNPGNGQTRHQLDELYMALRRVEQERDSLKQANKLLAQQRVQSTTKRNAGQKAEERDQEGIEELKRLRDERAVTKRAPGDPAGVAPSPKRVRRAAR